MSEHREIHQAEQRRGRVQSTLSAAIKAFRSTRNAGAAIGDRDPAGSVLPSVPRLVPTDRDHSVVFANAAERPDDLETAHPVLAEAQTIYDWVSVRFGAEGDAARKVAKCLSEPVCDTFEFEIAAA